MVQPAAGSLAVSLTPGCPPRRKPLKIQRFLTRAKVPAGQPELASHNVAGNAPTNHRIRFLDGRQKKVGLIE
jgi:hypothetical protein